MADPSFYIVLGMGLGVLVGMPSIAITTILYDRHLRKNITNLEAKYEELYGNKPRGPRNETFGGLADYKTFLKYAVSVKK